MSRTATGAVLVSALIAFFVGPELGFGPITSTSRADERPREVPEATVVVIRPVDVKEPVTANVTVPPPPAPEQRVSRSGARAAVSGSDVWARLRACESPTNGGTRYRGYYQFSQSSWQRAGGTGDPAAASLEEQTARAQWLAAHSNPAQQWPVCWRRANR
jgi:transglycosylase-like protein